MSVRDARNGQILGPQAKTQIAAVDGYKSKLAPIGRKMPPYGMAPKVAARRETLVFSENP